MHRVQVLHETLGAQDPAHLDHKHRRGEAFRGLAGGVLHSQPPFLPGAIAGRGHPLTCRLTFQPVALKVLPALPMVRVRSHMPGRLAAQSQREQLLRWGRGAGKGWWPDPSGPSGPHSRSSGRAIYRMYSRLPA